MIIDAIDFPETGILLASSLRAFVMPTDIKAFHLAAWPLKMLLQQRKLIPKLYKIIEQISIALSKDRTNQNLALSNWLAGYLMWYQPQSGQTNLVEVLACFDSGLQHSPHHGLLLCAKAECLLEIYGKENLKLAEINALLTKAAATNNIAEAQFIAKHYELPGLPWAAKSWAAIHTKHYPLSYAYAYPTALEFLQPMLLIKGIAAGDLRACYKYLYTQHHNGVILRVSEYIAQNVRIDYQYGTHNLRKLCLEVLVNKPLKHVKRMDP